MLGTRLLRTETGDVGEPRTFYFLVEGWAHPIAVSALEAEYARVLDGTFLPEASLEQRAAELARLKVAINQRENARHA